MAKGKKRCPKCETILTITTLKGDGPIKVSGHSHDITHHSHILAGGKSKIHDVWFDDAESATPDGGTIIAADEDDIDDPASDYENSPSTSKPPDKLGTIEFASLADKDGICHYQDITDDPCKETGAWQNCESAISMRWSWGTTTLSQKYGFGASSFTRMMRGCREDLNGDGTPDGESTDYVSTADMWEAMLTVPTSSVEDRLGYRIFWASTCGVMETYRISFYDTTASASPRVGMIDNYIDISVGCEGCCGRGPEA